MEGRVSITGIGDRVLLGMMLLLVAVGIVFIYSAGQLEVPTSTSDLWVVQIGWFVISMIAFLIATRLPIGFYEWVAPWVYGMSMLLLVLVLFIGTGPNGGWLDLGVGRLQPAEVAKLGTILMLARVMVAGTEPPAALQRLAHAVLVVMLPTGLILLQPDIGSALPFGVILFAAMFWAGVPPMLLLFLASPMVSFILGFSVLPWGVWFVLIIGCVIYMRPPFLLGASVLAANAFGGAVTQLVWNSLADYQQKRILVFLDPGMDPRGAGWNLIQSKVAIGNGGLLGNGLGEGLQKRLAFVPERHTDFIISVVGEELGFLGICAILTLCGLLLMRILRAATLTPDEFGAHLAFSLFALLLVHLIVNVGMAAGVMPITGLPLPLLSYGGSFLLILFILFGITQRVAYER